MILYDHDFSAILAEPLNSQSAAKFLRAFSKLHHYLTSRGHRPVLQILDNECPQSLKQYMQQTDTKYQLVKIQPHVNGLQGFQ
jgi:hypothetical protein